jgi:hypothetical protein
MFAIVEKMTNQVLDISLETDYKKAKKNLLDNQYLVEMTIKNSPGYVFGIYKDGKFYPPKGYNNGK